MESDHDSSDEQEFVLSSDEEDISPRKKGKTKADSDAQGIIVQTAFDTYFTQMAARAVTSSNIFSHLVPPLSADEYRDAISEAPEHRFQSAILSEPVQGAVFRQMMLQLSAGFNILCYGFGSKRRLLNKFATDYCSKAGHVVVANGFLPDFNLKELFNSIENLLGITGLPLLSSTPESQAQRINEFFAAESARHLYLIIHNIDSSTLRATRAKTCLSIISLNPAIHIVASVDHINSPLLWSTSETSARKDGSSSRGFSWLWHDLTTLAPYDFELAFADSSSISALQGRKQRDAAAVDMVQGTVSETAALHVLASVTQKAKKLFLMMGKTQIEAIDEAELAASNDLQQFAQSYNSLFNRARDNFIATSDTALRSLLGEFRDHGLVKTSQGGSGGEMLWIPMRKDRLSQVLQSIQSET